MTPFDKFKETAALVNLWIREEQPKIERFGCNNCHYSHANFQSFDRFLRINIEPVTVCRIGTPL